MGARRTSPLPGLTAVIALLLAPAAAARAEPALRPVRVGVYPNKPKIFTDLDGKAAGIFVDVLSAVAAAEGWSVTYVPCQWAECLRALEAGELDLVPDVAYSDERSARFDFHRVPVLESWSQFYARPGLTLTSTLQLDRRRVAVLEGSIQHDALAQWTRGLGLAVEIVPTESWEAAFDQVVAGTADVVVVNHFFGDYFYHAYGLVKTPVVLQAVTLFFAAPKGRHADLLAAIDRDLEAWRAEPRSPYYSALSHWMDRAPIPFVPPYVVWVVGAAVGLLLLAIGAALLLRRQVRTRTLRLVEARRALERSRQLEALGRLAGGVAHDFNNLLSVIINYTGFALERLPPDDASRADLEEVRRAGERAADMTRKLLAFSRGQILEPVVLDLNRVIRGVEGMLRRLLGEDIEIVLGLAEGLGRVEADPGQLEQIVTNLALNARDAMPGGGRLTIATADVALDQAQVARHPGVKPGRFVRLSVSDTGCGMDAATLGRIFDPFFTTKEKGKGTGLGLSTVFGIVAQSRGLIEVRSEPGRGTVFEIFLPRVEAAASEVAPRPPPAQRGGHETVLLVEDEDAVRDLVARVLRTAGYRVLAARDGADALRLLAEQGGAIDLLLTDLVMPQMDGKELADRLAGSTPGLRVLFMSGFSDDVAERRGAYFLAKPFSAEALARKVREVLDQGRAGRA